MCTCRGALVKQPHAVPALVGDTVTCGITGTFQQCPKTRPCFCTSRVLQDHSPAPWGRNPAKCKGDRDSCLVPVPFLTGAMGHFQHSHCSLTTCAACTHSCPSERQTLGRCRGQGSSPTRLHYCASFTTGEKFPAAWGRSGLQFHLCLQSFWKATHRWQTQGTEY